MCSKEIKKPEINLAFFVLGLMMLLVFTEILVRSNRSVFEGASHRMLAKLATFERKPRVDFLFFGTSRTQDGIAPKLVSRHLQEISPEFGELVGFNAAAMTASIDDLLSIAPRYLNQPTLRTVFIELSIPHLGNQSTLPKSSIPSQSTLEEQLALSLQKIALIKYRTAFRPGNLGSISSLLFFSSSMSGCETRFKDIVSAWLGNDRFLPGNFHQQLGPPEIISSQNTVIPLNDELDKVATKLSMLSNLFLEKGIKVIFIVPPASTEPLPERDSLVPFYKELARRTHNEVWNFVSLTLPNTFFKDSTHLSKNEGQPQWSFAVANQLSKVLEIR